MAQQLDQAAMEGVYKTYMDGRTWDAESMAKGLGAPALIPIILDYQSMFGRYPTAQEVSQANPMYTPNREAGAAWLSGIAKTATNPITAQPKYADVDSAFQQYLGRSATQEEKDHFGSMLANGQTDVYGLGTMLQQLPDYVKKQDAEFRSSLSSDLQTSNSKYFSEKILPAIQKQFTDQGRSFDDSGFKAATVLAAEDQNTGMDSFLANLTANQYEGSKANARSDYWNYLTRNWQTTDAGTARGNDIMDYNTQKQAYDDYLRSYGKRSNAAGIGSLVGGTAGAVAGSFSGTPFGVAAGWQAGSGIGGGVGSFF